MTSQARLDAAWSCARYEAARARLPTAAFPAATRAIATLEDLAGDVDAFALDAFGVLNVGDAPIPGAAERLARLRAMGKRLLVLTNGATQARAAAHAKYRAMGFDFAPEEVVASRDVAAAALAARPGAAGMLWAAASGPAPDFSDIPLPMADLLADPALFDRADGFVLFSASGWSDARQARLVAALRARPRPLVVANPDIVAPRERGFTLEPGHFAHLAADATGVAPEFHGKPFPGAYAEVLRRLAPIPPMRIAAVGDTLHTDILGGRAAGMRTVLARDHGLFAGVDPAPFVAQSGIVPDFALGAI
ncbi:MAG: HAD-IIA family hydrolase [Rubrimonas sp.]|uniref:HAD-IIA family hydrolase n=1 Tax=Rubrimonas sp. TaxID=2036015 RepID=UPI002FDE343B